MKIPEFVRRALLGRANAIISSRAPDFIIKDQTLRWWLIPRNKFFNVYLHKWVGSDEDRAMHDHPWRWNMSILLEGDYIEHVQRCAEIIKFADKNDIEIPSEVRALSIRQRRDQGEILLRRGASPHRVELYMRRPDETCAVDKGTLECAPVITLFLTGSWFRTWGFLCPKGWRHWEDFCDKRDHGKIGRGCE